MEKKKKSKEIFTLIMGCLMCCVVLCIAGCGGKSCQKPNLEISSEHVSVVIPGFAGCLTSGWGCNTGCWSQAYGCVAAREGCSNYGVGVYNIYAGSNGCIGCGETGKVDAVVISAGCDGASCIGTIGDCNGCGVGYNKYTGCDAAPIIEPEDVL